MRDGRGLTLIELLTALAVMALLATLGWRSLDGLLRVRELTQARSQALTGWADVLAQWQIDLDRLAGTAGNADPTWVVWSSQGHTVRLLRQAAEGPGWQVVAWAATGAPARWTRWQSPPLRQRAEIQQAWELAAQRVRTEGVATVPLSALRVQVWDGSRWIEAPDDGPPPRAVRLQLTPADSSGPAGPLTLDWVSPQVAGGKS